MAEIDLSEMETWESMTDSRVWWQITDSFGRVAWRSVIGKGTRVRIKRADRSVMQEMNPDGNCFVNGSLALVREGKVVAPSTLLGTADEDLASADLPMESDLSGILKMRQPRIERELAALSETSFTRLQALINDDTSASAVAAVKAEKKRRNPGEAMSHFEDIASGRAITVG